MGVKRMIDVHIEELVFDGVTAVDPEQVRAAVERELSGLMTERNPRAASDGEAAQPTPESIGAHVAGAVHRQVGR
jgi:hypothetical protein